MIVKCFLDYKKLIHNSLPTAVTFTKGFARTTQVCHVVCSQKVFASPERTSEFASLAHPPPFTASAEQLVVIAEQSLSHVAFQCARSSYEHFVCVDTFHWVNNPARLVGL
jgi:hypothetical protein